MIVIEIIILVLATIVGIWAVWQGVKLNRAARELKRKRLERERKDSN